MSYGEVLFQGTWEEAVRHADTIPQAKQVQVVEVEKPEDSVSNEQFRAIVADLVREAREIDATVSEEEGTTEPDAYTLALEDKYRRMGLKLE